MDIIGIASSSTSQQMPRMRRLKMAHINTPGAKDKKIPAIRIAGQYLSALGFKVGGFLKMEINPDYSITLRPDDNPNDEIITVTSNGTQAQHAAEAALGESD